jgi:dolichol-phosphate mannosyltransferase
MSEKKETIPVLAVVIPSYRVKSHILNVITSIGPEALLIYVVDDKCPENSGDYVEQNCSDPRVRIIRHEVNQGVGGAVMTGYRAAIKDGADIMVKMDGDGQMDPTLLMDFVNPILSGEADYTKGNRFYDLEEINAMPKIRILGNAMLSLMCKFSSGYWDLFDPTNGYTAIHRDLAAQLPYNKISNRYFFETDMLFRINTLRAVAIDIPMNAKYGDEVSGLKISKIIGEFFVKHLRNTLKRIFYNYYLRDLTIASIELPIGILLLFFGILFGLYSWSEADKLNTATSSGTVMISALPILVGIQLILAFISYDVANMPKRPLQLKNRLRIEFNKSFFKDKKRSQE